MAAVTLLGAATFATASGTKTVTATPAVGDLIVIVVAHSGNTANVAPTDNQTGGTYTQINTCVKATSADTMQMWVRDDFILSAVSTIFTHAPGASTGGGLAVHKITGMFKAGTAAVKQSAVQSNQAASGTPTPVLGVAALTDNPLIGAVYNATNPATLTPRTSWTETADVGHAAPVTGLETMSRDSGETATSIAWGGTSASAFASIVAEFDISEPPAMPAGVIGTRGDLANKPYPFKVSTEIAYWSMFAGFTVDEGLPPGDQWVSLPQIAAKAPRVTYPVRVISEEPPAVEEKPPLSGFDFPNPYKKPPIKAVTYPARVIADTTTPPAEPGDRPAGKSLLSAANSYKRPAHGYSENAQTNIKLLATGQRPAQTVFLPLPMPSARIKETNAQNNLRMYSVAAVEEKPVGSQFFAFKPGVQQLAQIVVAGRFPGFFETVVVEEYPAGKRFFAVPSQRARPALSQFADPALPQLASTLAPPGARFFTLAPRKEIRSFGFVGPRLDNVYNAATPSTYILDAGGSLSFSGAANIVHMQQVAPSGEISFSGTAAGSVTQVVIPSGIIEFSGSATIDFLPGGVSLDVKRILLLGVGK